MKDMKKVFISLVLLLTTVVAGAKVYQPGDDLNYKYDDESQTATVIAEEAMYKTDVSGFHVAPYNTYCGDIVIPETAPNGYTVVAIGNGAFQRCTDHRLLELNGITAPTITSISIPKTVKMIGDNAFQDCNLLESFTIPATVEEIGNNVFNYTSITTMTIEDTDMPLLIGNGITSDKNVFGSASSLTTVYAGRDLVAKSTQNTGPFQFAESITDITYGPKVTKLNKHEFWRCKSVKNVIILSTQVTEIPEDAFGECSALESVTLPESINNIASGAFIWCNALRDIVLPSALKTIGNQAFDGCPLTPLFTIPASVENIGNVAFRESSVTALTIADSDQTLVVGGGATTDIYLFGGMFGQNCTVYVGRDITCGSDFGPFRHAKNLTQLTYGPKVTKLNAYEAQGCETLEKIVCLSDKITNIPNDAFAACSKLASVQLPARLESIGKQAFSSTALKSVTLPETVTDILDFAFISSPLETLYALPVTPPTCANNVFANGANRTIYDNCLLFVPDGSLEAYKEAPVWKEFFNTQVNGIAEVESEGSVSGKAYDLLGRRAASGALRGVTIRNGKKVLTK